MQKKRFSSSNVGRQTVLTLFFALLAIAQGAWAEDIVISSASDWQNFADRVNAGETTLNASLAQDVDLGNVQAMVGTSSKKYQGRFDGKGHTLTVHYTTSSEYCAPFRYINVAKIMNLHVAGSITTSAKFAAGIAGNVVGVGNVVMNCRVSTTITSSVNGDGTHGGFFCVVEGDVRMTVSECVFNGKLLTTNGTTSSSGFAGFSRSWFLYFNNCLFDPLPPSDGETAISEGSCTFARKADQSSFYTTNCYYTTPMGTAQGEDGSSLDAATLAQRLGKQWTVEDGKAVPLMNRTLISGRGTPQEPYIIASADDWNIFCAQVNSGENFLNERLELTADITVSEMAGTPNTRFSGSFYGNGHTLTFNHTATEAVCAPFRYVSGVTIFGLHTAGTIETAYPEASGLVGENSADDNCIFNCRSSIIIRSSVNGSGNHGGFVAKVYRNDIALNNCLFDGAILTTNGTTDCGGLIGYGSSRILVRNCLTDPAQVGVNSGGTLVRNLNQLKNENCYYTKTIGEAQGTDASAMTVAELVKNLGAMWEVEDGHARPIMNQRPLSGEGSESSPYIIASVTDWHHFCTNVANGEFYSGKHVKMTEDIDIGDLQAMVGGLEHQFYTGGSGTSFDFEGIFDGDGHTLTVAYKTNEKYCAPFRFVKAATIKNLKTAGTIDTNAQCGAGIVALSDYTTKTTYLQNCLSSIVLTSSVAGNGFHGGLLAEMGNSVTLSVSGCVFNGKLLTTNGTTECGGLVGSYSWAGTVENSAFAPQALAEGETAITNGCTLVRVGGGNTNNLTISNSYYGQKMSTLQGSPIASNIIGDEGVVVNILTEPQLTICDVPFYTSGTEVELSYTGSLAFNHYETSSGIIGNAFIATGNHTLNEILGEVVISVSDQTVDRELYIAYDDDVATYYYDNQRSKHRFTGNPSDGEYIPAVPNGAQRPKKAVVDASMQDARPTVETIAMFAFSSLKTVEGLENLNLSKATSLMGMFFQAELDSIDLSMLDTHNITDMNRMFDNCNDLKSVTFGGNFTTANVTNMSAMFFACYALADVDLTSFNTEKVTNMAQMFGYCGSLKRLDLSSFKTPRLTKTEQMFLECGALTTICVDQNKWSVSNVTESSEMFRGCGAIVGCKGTTYNANRVSKSNAVVDDGTRGYLWDVTDLPFQNYIVYNSDDQTLNFVFDRWRVSLKSSNYATYDLPTTNSVVPWNEHSQDIKAVSFMPQFSTARPTTTCTWFFNFTSLETINGMENLNTSEVTNMASMFNNCKNLQELDVSHFDTQKVADMSSMFRGCNNLTTLDVSGFSTNKVRTLANMFSECSNLTTLDVSRFNTDNVTDMKYMFYKCSALTELDVSNFNTAKVDTLESMFYGCASLKTLDVSHFNTAKSSRMLTMFRGCTSLTSLDVSNFNTAKGLWMQEMFMDCSSLTQLDVSNFDLTTCYDASDMFKGCSSLKKLNVKFSNTSGVKSLSGLFEKCSSLTMLDLSSFNTAGVTYMGSMFYGCNNLKTIYVSDLFTTDNVEWPYGGEDMFTYCYSIVGGNGTTYQGDSFESYVYAHIDGVNGIEGYFTSIDDMKPLKGDVNRDGFVDVADVTLLVDILLGVETEDYSDTCDVSEDGITSIADVTALVDIILN